jgi:hypothetical protein
MAMTTIGGLLALAGLWLAVTAWMARGELNQVRTQAHTVGARAAANDWTGARSTGKDLAAHAHRAHQLTSGPIWALAARLPSGGEPLKTVRGITAAVDTVGADVLPQLISAGERLNPRTLRRPDGSIDLVRIAALGPAVRSASATMSQATTAMGALPRHTWLGSVDAAYAEALSQITATDHALSSADLAVRILPPMLGKDGPKRYFLTFQNEAEARGTGGLPGAFAIVEANHGRLRFARMESDTALNNIGSDVRFGGDFGRLYAGAAPTTYFGNSNLSPHFPFAAQIWASMWKKYSGETVDGAIAVDPTALSYLLAATGPATLSDKTQISAENAVELTQSSSYAKFPSSSEASVARRRAFLLNVASAASKKILGSRGEPTDLLRAAGKAAGERRLLVWSADPAVQSDLAKTSVAGVVPETRAPYVGLSIVNGGGNKLDYYLRRSLTWQRTGCGSTRRTTVTIKLTNDAPATGLPEYVTGRTDARSYRVKPGDSRLGVSYFATQGTVMNSITVGGSPGKGRIGAERGHPVYALDVEIPRGTTRTIVLRLTEPGAAGAPVVLRQPLVHPLEVRLQDAICN